MSRRVFERYLRETEERQLFSEIRRQAGLENQHQLLAMRDYAWMQFLRFSGIRVETMAGLNVADAMEAIATNYIQLRAEICKGRRSGKIYCSKSAVKTLRTLLMVRSRMGYPDNLDEPLVYSQKKERMSVRSYQYRMALWVKKSGLQVHASPHWLRHTFAKRIIKNSTARDPRGIAQVALNHNDINSTAIYTQPDRDDIEQALEEINR